MAPPIIPKGKSTRGVAIVKRAGVRKPTRNPSTNPARSRLRDNALDPANEGVDEMINEGKLEIGLDLGTVRTAVAYRITKPGERVAEGSFPLHDLFKSGTTVTIWPRDTEEQDSVESISMYPKNGEGRGGEEKYFGNSVIEFLRMINQKGQLDTSGNMDIIRYVKLLLHKSQSSARLVAKLGAIAQRRGVKELDFLDDFLSFIFDCLLGDEGFFTIRFPYALEYKRSVTLGCPASWADQESGKLLKMAQIYFDNVILGSEAEATMCFFAAQNEGSIEAGDFVFINDLGGGTVDLAVYSVEGVKPLKLSEACISDSVLCGGVFIDEKFRDLILERFFPGQADSDIVEQDLDWAVRQFEETTKRTFDGDEEPFMSGFAMSLQRTKTMIQFTSDELRQQVFDPTIEEIQNAVQSMLDRTKDKRQGATGQKMVFGGGLARNKYMMSKLKGYFGSLNNMTIVPPTYTYRAPNAHGLLLIGTENGLNIQRRARKTVGLYNIERYNAISHDPRAACGSYIDPGGDLVVNSVLWLIRRDQIVPDNYEYRRKRVNVIQLTADSMEEVIYISDSHPPPNEDATILAKDDSEENLVNELNMTSKKLDWKLEGLDKQEHFKLVHYKGADMYEVEWDIIIKFSHGQLSISVELKSESDQPLISSERPLAIDLDTEQSNYVSLGSLSTRYERRLAIAG